eukprot:UN18446
MSCSLHYFFVERERLRTTKEYYILLTTFYLHSSLAHIYRIIHSMKTVNLVDLSDR